jgi:hypothetical protein
MKILLRAFSLLKSFSGSFNRAPIVLPVLPSHHKATPLNAQLHFPLKLYAALSLSSQELPGPVFEVLYLFHLVPTASVILP